MSTATASTEMEGAEEKLPPLPNPPPSCYHAIVLLPPALGLQNLRFHRLLLGAPAEAFTRDLPPHIHKELPVPTPPPKPRLHPQES